MTTMPSTKYARSGDVHIAYQVAGDGPQTLVVVPGWVSHPIGLPEPMLGMLLDSQGPSG